MATIDIKLKTYEQLQFEIMKLNTDIILKDKEIERLNNIIDEIKEKLKFALKCKDSELQCVFEAYEIEEMINKLELKEGKNNAINHTLNVLKRDDKDD